MSALWRLIGATAFIAVALVVAVPLVTELVAGLFVPIVVVIGLLIAARIVWYYTSS